MKSVERDTEAMTASGDIRENADNRHRIPAHLRYTVFPIVALKRTDDHPSGAVTGDPKIQGTAMMLSHDGLFLTAGHCVNVGFGEKDITGKNAHDPNDYAIVAIHEQQRGFKFCRVLELSISSTCDVAIGRAEVPGSDYPDTLGLGTGRLGRGASVFGIGYPETDVKGEPGGPLSLSMNSWCHVGRIDEWRPSLIPWPSAQSAAGYCHSVRTPPGFSGGPFDPKAHGPRARAHGRRIQ